MADDGGQNLTSLSRGWTGKVVGSDEGLTRVPFWGLDGERVWLAGAGGRQPPGRRCGSVSWRVISSVGQWLACGVLGSRWDGPGVLHRWRCRAEEGAQVVAAIGIGGADRESCGFACGCEQWREHKEVLSLLAPARVVNWPIRMRAGCTVLAVARHVALPADSHAAAHTWAWFNGLWACGGLMARTWSTTESARIRTPETGMRSTWTAWWVACAESRDGGSSIGFYFTCTLSKMQNSQKWQLS
jgi:hypothetical protein